MLILETKTFLENFFKPLFNDEEGSADKNYLENAIVTLRYRDFKSYFYLIIYKPDKLLGYINLSGLTKYN